MVLGTVLQQPVLSTGHDQIFACGGICATNGHGTSINLVPQLAAREAAAAK
jgi:hypothetical protein